MVASIVDVLVALKDLRRDLDRLEYTVVTLLRANGATWEQIGEEMGITRQSARQRFGEMRKRQVPKAEN